MEGQENQKIDEHGAPEVQKCCSVCILRFAAFENASHRFFVQSAVLHPEMVPKWSQNGVGESIFEGSIFDANFEVKFFSSGLPREPPEVGASGRGRADLRLGKVRLFCEKGGFRFIVVHFPDFSAAAVRRRRNYLW